MDVEKPALSFDLMRLKSVSPLAVAFGEFWRKELSLLGGYETGQTQLAACFFAFVHAEAEKGHICLRCDFNRPEIVQELRHSLQLFFTPWYSSDPAVAEIAHAQADAVLAFIPDLLCQKLLVSTDPLELDRPFLWIKDQYFYLRRLYLAESRLLELLKLRAAQDPIQESDLNLPLDLPAFLNEGQREALKRARYRKLFFLTGGPGTGKTTTAATLLRVFIQDRDDTSRPLRVYLTAPTGLAALRLSSSDSMKKVKDAFGPQDLSLVEGTLQRLVLQGQRIPGDVFLIDEASMIDLDLMVKTLSCVPLGARLIFLGDEDQLPSVDTGALLGDLSAAADHEGHFLAGRFYRLTQSQRFSGELADLAQSIRRGESAKAWEILKNGGEDIQLRDLPPRPLPQQQNAILQIYAEEWKQSRARWFLKTDSDPSDLNVAFEHLNRRFILTPTHDGPWGTLALEAYFERSLGGGRHHHYHGRPLLITKNSRETGLFNGDRGLILEQSGRLWAFFPRPGQSVPYLRIAPAALGEFTTCYSLSIHKSQGSEASEVVLFLPADTPNLSREIIFTGMTRTKKKLIVYGTGVGAAPIQRHSSLRARDA